MTTNKKLKIGIIIAAIAVVAAVGTVIAVSAAGNIGADVSYGKVSDELHAAISEAIFTHDNVSMSDIVIDGETRHYVAAEGDFSECFGEGHVILGTKETDGGVDVYALCSVIGYGFRDGKLVDEYGFWNVPTLLQFKTDTATDTYTCTNYKETEDGGEWEPSLYRMFPRAVAKEVMKVIGIDSTDKEMDAQIRAYAEAYLKHIGRDAKISSYHDEDFKILTDYGVSVEVSNELSEMHQDYGIYVGSFERVENGERYVYYQLWEQDGSTPGNGKVTFRKVRDADGQEIEKIIYEVKGDSFTRIDHE